MNEIITYRNNGFDMGRVCVEVNMRTIMEGATPQQQYDRIQSLINTQMEGKWIVGLYKHRIPLIFTNVLNSDDIDFIHGILDIFSEKNAIDVEQLPKYVAIDIHDVVSIDRSFITTMRQSPMPIYISLVDVNGDLPVEFIQEMLTKNFGTNKANPVDYTLIIDDISILEFENYKAVKQDQLLNIKRKLMKVYIVDNKIDLLKFAAEYGFRYSNPIRDDFNSFYNIVVEMRDKFDNYSELINQLTQTILLQNRSKE